MKQLKEKYIFYFLSLFISLCLNLLSRHPLFGRHIRLSSGSGFIVTHSGVIVTNAHVVTTAAMVTGRPQLRVQLHDGEAYGAVVRDVDRKADIATIKINPQVTEHIHVHPAVKTLKLPFYRLETLSYTKNILHYCTRPHILTCSLPRFDSFLLDVRKVSGNTFINTSSVTQRHNADVCILTPTSQILEQFCKLLNSSILSACRPK